MKYIIELPEEVKEKFDNATKDDIYGSYYDYNSVIGNAIKNGTPLSEEPEKIRAEIKEKENNPDCRSCDKWKTCENGEKGHANGTSSGYSIGECRDYAEQEGENK